DRQGRPRFRHRRSLFKVSGFQGFIQIGVGIAIGIGIDHLTTKHTGWHCSGFYPQIYTDYADFWGIARVFWERQGEFLIFMKFHVFHGFI
ncbi:MAG TPA: hypothetical protein PLJ32_06435, partial [Kiritimatiellia bacterium]|nr:hypothetical protein [Kiritimatiellia bacterium]